MRALAASFVLASATLAAQQVTFTNVAEDAGVAHTYDNVIHGVGISFKDFNGDGWDDLTLGSSPDDSLSFYLNQNGTFQEISIFNEIGAHKMVLWADYDNDGDQDLFVCGWMTSSRLLHNNGNLNFTDVTVLAGLPTASLHASGASWGDYDRDGWLDLYINLYENTTEKNMLFRNLGDGSFDDVTVSSGVIDTPMLSFCSVFMDIDNDLWPDLYVANDYDDPNRMYHNLGNGTFSNFGDSSGTSIPLVDAMSTTAGDYNNDGYQDIYVTNTPLGNVLLRNNKDNTFTNVAAQAQVKMGAWAWGANWFDHDRDTDLDLYVNATFVSPLIPLSAMYDNLLSAGQDSFHLQGGTGFFDEEDEGRAQAIGDFDNDGWLDVAVTGESPDSLRLWQCNGGTSFNWLKVFLRGTLSNRDGTGAQVILKANGQRQYRFTMQGLGYINQNSADEYFGLGSASTVDSLMVFWPSGIVDTLLNVTANQRLNLIEGGLPIPNPVISASGPTTFCPGGTVTLNAGSWSSYKWSTGDTTAQITVAMPGLYNVTVTNAYGIRASATAPVEVANHPAVSFLLTHDDVTCFGAADGAAEAQVTSGTAPFSYAWSNGDSTASTFDLQPGTYLVTVTDDHSCSAVKGTNITQPALLEHTLINLIHPTCNGYSNGAIDQSVSGGTQPYSYTWSSGTTAQDLLTAQAGTYTVTIADARGCQLTHTFTLIEPPGMSLYASASPAQCNGLDDGSVDLTVADAKPPVSFLWSNGAITEDLSDVGVGAYSVTVTDSSGCNKSLMAIVGHHDSLMIAATIDEVVCHGQSNGAIDLTVTNGHGGYAFEWSSSETGEDLVMIQAGDYAVTVTDSTGCEVSDTFQVAEPDELWLYLASAPVSCFGAPDGSVASAIDGGNGWYSLLWSTNETTWDIHGLPVGQYSLTVTDIRGCSVEDSIVVTGPPPIELSFSSIHVDCHGASTGNIDVTATGGQGIFWFEWSSSDLTEDLTNIPAGTYSLTVMDTTGCTDSLEVVITEPPALLVQSNVSHVSCYGYADGAVTLVASGGVPGYAILWSTLDTTATITSLPAGPYIATITDANGCDVTEICSVSQPDSIVIIGAVDEPSCFGAADGSISVSLSGGTAPFEFLWSDSTNSASLLGVTSGTYSVQVSDDSGCLATVQWFIAQPDQLILDGFSTPDTAGQGVGSGSVNATGGTPPYSYLWNDPLHQATAVATNLLAGAYTVTVTDSLGCQDSVTVTVSSVTGLTYAGDAGFLIMPNPATSVVSITVPVAAFRLRVLGTDGRVVLDRHVPHGDWQLDVAGWPRGVYAFEVTAKQQRSLVKVVIQ